MWWVPLQRSQKQRLGGWRAGAPGGQESPDWQPGTGTLGSGYASSSQALLVPFTCQRHIRSWVTSSICVAGLWASDLNYLSGSARESLCSQRGTLEARRVNNPNQPSVHRDPSFLDSQWDSSKVCSTHVLRGSPEELTPVSHLLSPSPQSRFWGEPAPPNNPSRSSASDSSLQVQSTPPPAPSPGASPALCSSGGWVLIPGQVPHGAAFPRPQRKRQRTQPVHVTLPARLNHRERGTPSELGSRGS